MTSAAAKKTAGVVGDDLALNAHQLIGLSADRELPVVMRVARGSAINKLILVPLALCISYFTPWAIHPLLMIGGLYLCYEGCEKLLHRWLHSSHEDAKHHTELLDAIQNPQVDLLELEKEKIRGAIRTDFVLSAEIITLALGTVAATPQSTFTLQVIVLAIVAVAMTVGVYGLVAGIVKLDDAGLHLASKAGENGWARWQRSFGRFLLRLAPGLMRFLSIAGTIAMFAVGGGIIAHAVPGIEEPIHRIHESMAHLPGIGGIASVLSDLFFQSLVGVLAGLAVVAVMEAIKRLWRRLAT